MRARANKGDNLVATVVIGKPVEAHGSCLGDATPVIVAGAGSPSADLALPNGSLYLRSDGGEGSTFYVREEGRWTAK